MNQYQNVEVPVSTKGCTPRDKENMNGDRAEWAGVALEAFQEETGAEDEHALHDLLCNLMHWCDRNDQSFAGVLEQAVNCYRDEIGD